MFHLFFSQGKFEAWLSGAALTFWVDFRKAMKGSKEAVSPCKYESAEAANAAARIRCSLATMALCNVDKAIVSRHKRIQDGCCERLWGIYGFFGARAPREGGNLTFGLTTHAPSIVWCPAVVDNSRERKHGKEGAVIAGNETDLRGVAFLASDGLSSALG